MHMTSYTDDITLIGDAYYSLGVLYNRWPTLLPDPEAAVRVLTASREVLAQSSAQPASLTWSVLLALGDAYLKHPHGGLERIDQALRCYTSVIEHFEPLHSRTIQEAALLAEAYLGAGNAYRRLAERGRALAMFDRALSLDAEPGVTRQAELLIHALTQERVAGQIAA